MTIRKSSFRTSFFLISLLALAMLVLTACGDQESQAQPLANQGANNDNDRATENTETPAQNKPIVLYANDFVDVIGDMFKEATGYEVEVVHGGGGEVLSRVEAEQGNPQWDVIWLDGHASLYGLAERGFFLKDWEPSNLENLNEQGKELLHPNNAYFPTGVHAAATIAYNTNLIDPSDAPQTWEEFFSLDQPIAMADPGIAAPAYPVVSWFFYDLGMEPAEEMFDQLFSQKNLHVFPKNGPVGNAVATGEVAAAALQEHNGYALMQAGEPIEMIWPEEGSPGSVRVAAIGKHTENVEVAKAFIEFLLDPETQNQLTALDDTEGYFTPFVKDVSPNPAREKDPVLALPDVKWASEYESYIKQWFADRAVQ
ncbi:extracellular solute-binding protein [Bacillus horti]|uniref:Iron(III) transport system substrate-binding protein n=1 Tax=Caldalkalibacillus horti TaxID=77523 RepID=A0ABT9VXW5_9BACI|nr:extracellular solute-binding protein [Bacillus horti]MDQ0165834.1 iron(III) transport system substrate-binding protein [Bacillus horti]